MGSTANRMRLLAGVVVILACGSTEAIETGKGVGATRGHAFEPVSLQMGSVAVGGALVADVVVRSTGNSPVAIDVPVLVWADPTFSILSDGCSGVSLLPDATCSLTVRFQPDLLGERQERLRVHSDATITTSTLPLAIAAEGLPVAGTALAVVPAEIDFGPFVVGALSAARLIELINIGDTAISVTSRDLQGADASAFILTGADTCSGASLAPGGQCEMNVRFEPVDTGALAATLRIHSNAPGSPHMLPLAGSGTAQPGSRIEVDATALDFGVLAPGQSAGMALQYASTGTDPVSIEGFNLSGPDAAVFDISSNLCGANLPPGNECTIVVRFSPNQQGAFTAQVQIDADADSLPLPVIVTGDSAFLAVEVFHDGFEP